MERAIPWGVFVALMTAACFWRPRAMRVVVGVFFALMGLGVHGAFIATRPEGYLDFARQALIPFYAELAPRASHARSTSEATACAAAASGTRTQCSG